ncbi:DUF551 domain-containing protein [Enterobacter roggenkampii]|uniref:DUF551 domain-containing protein n=1 Tax=Enterobacter roggenkampii TaxID=1812935 RepID=UPI002542F2CF|nr:DUF551 domain-containing protein [Enterobacter roggenkampii]WIJ49658.1 DUF551 domain-containing protein [Enterobacter roggenkampii]
MSNIDKQWLQHKIADMEAACDEIPFGLDEDDSKTLAALRIALASLEAEPAGWQVKKYGGNWVSIKNEDVDHYRFNEELPVREVYTAPPAPVSVPDEDLLHMAASAIDDLLSNKDRSGAGVWADIPAKLRRAAMLQGADRPQNEPQNIPENIPENIPATQFKPVADLYGLTSPTGGETSFTFDAVEARDFIDGGWSCQEYVELGRFQEAMLQNGNSPAQSDCCPEQNYIAPAQDGNSPVIPDGWVACSERMPDNDDFVYIWPRPDFGVELHVAQYGKFDRRDTGWYAQLYEQNFGIEYHPITVTHWMPLPAAPQQEMK